MRYPATSAVVVVEAQPSDIVTETITTIILAIIASLGAIAALCWLLFNLAVFALPFFAGVTVGIWAHGTGAGILGGVIVASWPRRRPSAFSNSCCFSFGRPG